MDNTHIIDLASPVPEGLADPHAETDAESRFIAMRIRLQKTVSEIAVIGPVSAFPPFGTLDYRLAMRTIQAMDDIVAAFVQNRRF